MFSRRMFEVWMTTGGGMKPGPKFGKLTDALHHIGTHIHEASFAIRLPEGDWYVNSHNRHIFSRRAHRTAGGKTAR